MNYWGRNFSEWLELFGEDDEHLFKEEVEYLIYEKIEPQRDTEAAKAFQEYNVLQLLTKMHVLAQWDPWTEQGKRGDRVDGREEEETRLSCFSSLLLSCIDDGIWSFLSISYHPHVFNI